MAGVLILPVLLINRATPIGLKIFGRDFTRDLEQSFVSDFLEKRSRLSHSPFPQITKTFRLPFLSFSLIHKTITTSTYCKLSLKDSLFTYNLHLLSLHLSHQLPSINMHSSLELIVSPTKSSFSIADLRNLPSPISSSSPFAALNKLEGRSAKSTEGATEKPQVSTRAKSAQIKAGLKEFIKQINLTEIPRGATGKPLSTALVDIAHGKTDFSDVDYPNSLSEKDFEVGNPSLRRQAFLKFQAAAMSRFPSLQVNGLSSVSEDPTSATTPTERTAEREEKRLGMLRRMRPPPLKYAWNFYHDKYSETKSYDERITLILSDVVTLKPFWGFLNNFPLHALKMKDSVHFFKRGIKPVWEDSRNINGGSWTFRIPKDKSEQFWKEALMLAIGEQFTGNLQGRK